jgi:Ferritin-like
MAKANGRAVEPLLTIDTREELVYLLGEASEIEHGLLCEYLYAQLSLKRGVGEGVSPEQLARIQHWELTMIDVIKQEMLHLALATNLLTAVGGCATLRAPQLPHPLALVSGGRPDRAHPLRRARATPLHVPGTPRRDGPRRC